MVATRDPVADELRRAGLQAPEEDHSDWPWIEGEVLDFQDAQEAWPPLDEWEGFVPGQESVYPRCVVPVEVACGDAWSTRLVWAYASTRVPPGSIMATNRQ